MQRCMSAVYNIYIYIYIYTYIYIYIYIGGTFNEPVEDCGPGCQDREVQDAGEQLLG